MPCMEEKFEFINFTPPFCTNAKCFNHLKKSLDLRPRKWWGKAGLYKVKNGTQVPRFKCFQCRKKFSARAFKFHYRFKLPDKTLSARIFKAFTLGATNRDLAFVFGVSEHCVRGRLNRMADWAFKLHQERLNELGTVNEDICYDGLENFAGTQYDPNYINQMIGTSSLFIYDFNLAPMNRKGRMSERQKLKNKELVASVGSYPKDAIRQATTALISRMLKRKKPGENLALISDEHFQYRRSIQYDLKGSCIDHITISAKAYRCFKNILFPVNHADLLIRKKVGAFSRETISFSKTHTAMAKKFLLFLIDKNYMRPQFTKRHKRRPLAHLQSPAQSLSIETHVLAFHEFFSEPRTEVQVPIPAEWSMIIKGQVPYNRSVLPQPTYSWQAI